MWIPPLQARQFCTGRGRGGKHLHAMAWIGLQGESDMRPQPVEHPAIAASELHTIIFKTTYATVRRKPNYKSTDLASKL
jgi:hypothetical protein